jgi:hypothetical protein
MFDSDGKKQLKNKKIAGVSDETDYESLTKGSSTVLSELKLSSILLDGVNESK